MNRKAIIKNVISILVLIISIFPQQTISEQILESGNILIIEESGNGYTLLEDGIQKLSWFEWNEDQLNAYKIYNQILGDLELFDPLVKNGQQYLRIKSNHALPSIDGIFQVDLGSYESVQVKNQTQEVIYLHGKSIDKIKPGDRFTANHQPGYGLTLSPAKTPLSRIEKIRSKISPYYEKNYISLIKKQSPELFLFEGNESEVITQMVAWMKNNLGTRVASKKHMWLPSSPLETLDNKNGECFSQSLLMSIVLESYGIKNDIALVQADLFFEGESLFQSYDHSLVYIVNSEYFVDPLEQEYLPGFSRSYVFNQPIALVRSTKIQKVNPSIFASVKTPKVAASTTWTVDMHGEVTGKNTVKTEGYDNNYFRYIDARAEDKSYWETGKTPNKEWIFSPASQLKLHKAEPNGVELIQLSEMSGQSNDQVEFMPMLDNSIFFFLAKDLYKDMFEYGQCHYDKNDKFDFTLRFDSEYFELINGWKENKLIFEGTSFNLRTYQEDETLKVSMSFSNDGTYQRCQSREQYIAFQHYLSKISAIIKTGYSNTKLQTIKIGGQ